MADETFATVADVADLLQLEISSPEQVTAVEGALLAATAHIRNYCHQYLSLVEDEVVALDSRGGARLFVPELPIVELVEVREGGAVVASSGYAVTRGGVLYRNGGRWKEGIGVIEVTYSHGYAEIPLVIVDVCTRAAARIYQAGLAAAANEGLTGISSKSLGDFAVSFAGEQGGGVSEGSTMGVSGARPLLRSEQDVLDHYRLVRNYRYSP